METTDLFGRMATASGQLLSLQNQEVVRRGQILTINGTLVVQNGPA